MALGHEDIYMANVMFELESAYASVRVVMPMDLGLTFWWQFLFITDRSRYTISWGMFMGSWYYIFIILSYNCAKNLHPLCTCKDSHQKSEEKNVPWSFPWPGHKFHWASVAFCEMFNLGGMKWKWFLNIFWMKFTTFSNFIRTFLQRNKNNYLTFLDHFIFPEFPSLLSLVATLICVNMCL